MAFELEIRAVSSPRQKRDRHSHAAQTDIWTQPLADPRCTPKDAHDSVFVAVQDTREDVVRVGAGADEEQDD